VTPVATDYAVVRLDDLVVKSPLLYR